MWISKKKYKDLQRKIKELNEDISKLGKKIIDDRDRIFQLMEMHDVDEDMKWNGKDFIRVFNRSHHKEPTITIGDIDNLTFTELAEYVINGKPITRVQEHEVVVFPKEDKDDE